LALTVLREVIVFIGVKVLVVKMQNDNQFLHDEKIFQQLEIR
jgi:hypothetical protein